MLQQRFIEAALDHELIAFGEHHGIRETQELFCRIAGALAGRLSGVLVLLERDFLEQGHVTRFVNGEPVEIDFVPGFPDSPRTPGELSGPGLFLQSLRRLNMETGCSVAVACIDIAHRLSWSPAGVDSDDPRVDVSRDILAVRDEDIFDAAREQFMFQEAARAIEEVSADRILFCGGNAHLSLTSWYFPRSGPPELHIPTLVGRIAHDLHRSAHVVYCLAASGQAHHREDGRMHIRELPPITGDPVFRTLGSVGRREGDRRAGRMAYTDLTAIPDSLPGLDLHRRSWHGILTMDTVTPDQPAG